MKRYLTLRLPAELARALSHWARSRRVPKSAVAREAVARYLAPTAPEGSASRVTARELAARWATLPHLTPQEARDLATDIAAAREALPLVRPAWE
jgi:predicted transcriptional regulator